MNKNECLNIDTEYIREEIGKCEDIEELKEKIFPLIKDQQEQWVYKINEIVKNNGYTQARFGELCGVSRITVNKWLNGIAIPRNRETFIRIGMAAKYNVEEMNAFLQRYGRYPALYSKSLEDCVCKYVLSHNYGEESNEKYKYILSKIKDTIIRDENDVVENVSTEKFDEKLSEIKSEEELEQFITKNIAMFSYRYHKFYAYVKQCIEINCPPEITTVHEMSLAQGWTAALRNCVSEIRQKKWYPTRNKIISLGLHLSMDHEQIDKMLELAYMEPLCGKNIFESIIMFILDDASLNNILDADSDPDGLCKYAKEVLEKFDIPYVASFISEIAEIDYEYSKE